MRAIVIERYGGPEVLAMRELPVPEPQSGEIRIKVKAFGINRAELEMRSGHWGQVSPITGIECVGVVDADPLGQLRRGRTVAAVVGGMGRTRPGSYAEYTCVPTTNVFALDTTLDWPVLAAIPESYATAWGALFDHLALDASHTLLIRGATSALGQAAVNIASNLGATVLATTRRSARAELLNDLGASRVLVDTGALAADLHGIDAVLDIVGNQVLRDSLRVLRKGGRLLEIGFLGGGAPVEAFNPLMDMPSGVDLRFYATGLVLGTPDYPISDIPMQDIVRKVEAGQYKAKPARVLPFDCVAEAHRLVESGDIAGKIVIVL
jgi:NADPH:quinone reductase-like Zn-dependent oxidoreductase